MRKTLHVLVLSLSTLAVCKDTAAQGNGGPLTVQGLQQQSNASATSRAFGGVTIGHKGHIELMFDNPAAMHGLQGISVSLGGVNRHQELRQNQRFAPVRYYPNLSLLLEGWTDRVPDPDPDLVAFTERDSVQRPFDDIRPNWSRSATSNLPLHAVLAAPFSVGNIAFVVGLGAVQYADLDHYYQNNNVLDPSVLSQRPLPTLRPTDNEPLTAEWYQATRSREGTMMGYGAGIAGSIPRYNLTLGVSGLRLDGDTDDFEQQVQRGRLTFFSNSFRVDSSAGRITTTGTSSFSATEFTFAGLVDGRYVDFGFTLKPPTTFARAFDLETVGDDGGASFTSSRSGEDSFQLPWRGSAGLLIQPRERLRIGLEYELRPFSHATFTDVNGEESSPWQSSSLFRIGTEYQLFRWLALRGGMRGEADVFVPEGSALGDEPAAYRVYSAGLGLSFAGLRWNVAYEQGRMVYHDIWSTALSSNRDLRRAVMAEVSYTIR